MSILRRLDLAVAMITLGVVLVLAGAQSALAQQADVPATPSRPTVDSVAHDSVTITWTDPGDSSITGYQVFRRDPTIHARQEFATIENDTGSSDTSYTDTNVDPETKYVYRIKARNANGLSAWSKVAKATTPADPTPADEAPSGLPTISGTEQVGETLSADTSGISDANGLTGVSYAYQWIRNDGSLDTNISGATGQTYTLADDDQGKTIKVQVSFTDDDGYSATLTSAATGSVAAPANEEPTGLPIIVGAVYIGETLSANTSGISDANGLTGVIYTYQWIRNDGSSDTNIPGATAQTYTLTDDDNEKTIKVNVGFTDDDGYSESLTSAATVSVSTLTPLEPPATTLASLPQQQAPADSVSEPTGQDFPADNTTTGWVIVGDGGATGNLGTNSDVDAFKINLELGKRYRIDVLGKGPRDHALGGTYHGELELQARTLDGTTGTAFERLNGFGEATPSDTTAANVVNKAGGPDLGARSEFNVTATDTYLIKVISDGSNTGTYTVKASEITSEQAFGDFTSQWNSGRIKIGDTAAMTGRIARSGDSDWYIAGLEAGKCYSIQVLGQHSDSAHDGGTLSDPKLKVMNFYDYYHRDFYDPDTLAYTGIPADEQDVEYYNMTYINPENFKLLNRADKICNMVSPSDQPSDYKLICNYYCDDDSGPGNNSLIKVRVKTGGAGDYVIGVEGQGSTGTYSIYVKEITCPT